MKYFYVIGRDPADPKRNLVAEITEQESNSGLSYKEILQARESKATA